MTHANRGKQLERAVRELFKRYAQLGIHCHQNFPRTLTNGTIVEKHGYDFEILYKGVLYAFDAKMCEQASWSLQNAKVHQIKALFDVTRNGGDGFFLVFFTRTKQLVQFHVPLPNDKKSLRPDDGVILSGLDFLNVFKDRK